MRWRIWALTLAVGLLSLWLVWAQSEKRVTIELKDAPIADAFDQLFRAVGENFILQPSVPKEQRLTMRLADVPFEKALNFLCDLTGLKWERKDGIYVINTLQRTKRFEAFVVPPPELNEILRKLSEHYADPKFWQEFSKQMEEWEKQFIKQMKEWEKRLTEQIQELDKRLAKQVQEIEKQTALPFIPLSTNCPKCGASIQRTCPQCKRPMQLYWQFCPFDGTKLPPAPEKCPKCGEQLLKTPMLVKVDTIDDELIFLFPWGITIQVLDEQGKVLVERKLEPQARGHFLGLSDLLGKKPKTGTYQLRLLKEGQEIAVISVVKR